MSTTPIALINFNNGDTDYVAKLNNNNATLTAFLDALGLTSGGSSTSPYSIALLLQALFGSDKPTIIGLGFADTPSGSTFNMAAGTVWLPASQTMIAVTSSSLSFIGQSAGTYYIEVSSVGVVSISSTSVPTNDLYSVVWTGSAFGTITELAYIFSSSVVPTVNTDLPLTGGGSLSSPITLAINDFTGDTGSGGLEGAVPAPAAGDAAAGKFLKADGTWEVPSAGSVTTGVSLTTDLPVFGAGTSAVKVGTKSGNTDELATVSGALTATHLVAIDASGNLVDGGAPPTGLPPSGTAGGDLSSTYPNPTVVKLNGVSLAGLATGLLKNTTATGVPSIATASDIPVFTGDSGSGGTTGGVPAPGAGTAAAGDFLKADGSWAVPTGGAAPAYSTYTPTITPSTGTATISYSNARYLQQGSIVKLRGHLTFTVSGSPLDIVIQLPVAALDNDQTMIVTLLSSLTSVVCPAYFNSGLEVIAGLLPSTTYDVYFGGDYEA